MTVAIANPYRGPFSFKENDENIFFGRNSEVEDLVSLIRKHQLTVLYGASGTGKTSLIHAKLLPQLKREYFHPIYIRINFANKEEDPLKSVQNRVVEELRIWDANIPEFSENQSLIDYAAKNVIFKGLIKPVLFFDQFEELFTLGPKNDPIKIHRFMFELSELIELRLPDNLKTLDYINNISSFKVVFSLRQDWIGFLDDFTQLIPSINEVRYRLKKFSPGQALDAIICPAQNYIDQDTAEFIVKKIGTPALWREDVLLNDNIGKELMNKEIDPFVLSLYCYQLFEKNLKEERNEIDIEFVQRYDDTELIKNYYEESVDNNKEIRDLIESKLLNESGKRLIMPLEKFVNSDQLLKKRTYEISRNTGITRIIGSGSESEIEIVHDRLAKQIFECKNERKTKELHDEASRKEQEADNLKKAAEKAKKTTFTLAMIGGLIVIALVVFMIRWAIEYNYDTNAQKLKTARDEEREKNKKGADSIAKLNALLHNINASSDINKTEIMKTNFPITKDYDLSKEKTKLLDSLALRNSFLEIEFQKLINKNTELAKNINDKEDQIRILMDNPTGNTPVLPPTTSPPSFGRNDFSDLLIVNTPNPDGSFNYDDIRKSGYKFSFNIKNIFDNQKGVIRFVVEFDQDHRSVGNIGLQEIRRQRLSKYTLRAEKDDILKDGRAKYKVLYVNNMENIQTTLSEGFLDVKKPPNEPVN